ncbi:MAG TPA: response regulator transcription factor [Acidimicrobiia bacterium]|nr:response regulator transcription factor [Acidimicrobiia bacterium]
MNADASGVRVLLVEDHEMVAQGLRAALSDEPDLEVVGWASTVADSIQQYASLRPDIVLMDYRLPDGTGTEAATRIRVDDPEACILLITGATDDGIVAAALEAGCSGFIGKDRDLDELGQAIRAAARGAAVFPADLLAAATRRGGNRLRVGADITERELEILRLLAEGTSTEDIAATLYLSHHTVRNHVRNLLAKLHAHTKLEAVVIAARAGLVRVGPMPD